MPQSHSSYLIIAFIFLGQIGLAQPETWQPVYEVTPEKNVGYYFSAAKKFQKDEYSYLAVINAAQCLSMEPKKRQLKNSIQILQEEYPDFLLENENHISQYSSLVNETIDTDVKANELWFLIKNYGELNYTNKLLKAIPPGNLKFKKEAFSFTPKDYSQQLLHAQNKMNEVKSNMAELHYQFAEELNQPELDIISARGAYHEYKLADAYQKNYKDTQDKILEMQKKGTRLYFVSNFGYSTKEELERSKKINASWEIYSKIVSSDAYKALTFAKVEYTGPTGMTIYQTIEHYNFLTTTSKNAFPDQEVYLLNGTHVNSEISEPASSKSTEEVESEVVIRKEKYTDSDGKEKERDIKQKVAAKYTVYEVGVTAKSMINISFTNTQSGEKLLNDHPVTGEYTWFNRWATYTGDKRALPPYITDILDDKKEIPKEEELLKLAANDYIAGLVNMLLEKMQKDETGSNL